MKMVCTSKQQAVRVAKAGAAKMNADIYRVEDSAFRALKGKAFRVRKIATGDTYHVGIEEGKEYCNCAFFRNNREHKTCKHIEKAKDEAAYGAWLEEKIAAFEMGEYA